MFTNEEYAVILYSSGFCDDEVAATRREYLARFRDRRKAEVSGVAYRRIREMCTALRGTSDAQRPRLYAVNYEEEILRLFEENPTISTYIVADRLRMSQ